MVFGYGLSVIFTFAAVRLWIKHGFSPVKLILLALALISFVVTFINYKWLTPVYEKWMKVASFIGDVVARVILTAIFYAVFGTTGLVLRILRRDLLDIQIDKSKKSYWIERKSQERGQEDYFQQF